MFENSCKSPKILIAEASGFIEAYDQVHGPVSNALSSCAQAWVAPLQGWFKVNCDAPVLEVKPGASLGCCIRNSEGDLLLAGQGYI